jgi:hypothetical protein
MLYVLHMRAHLTLIALLEQSKKHWRVRVVQSKKHWRVRVVKVCKLVNLKGSQFQKSITTLILLTITKKSGSIASLPGSSVRTSDGVVSTMTLNSETTRLSASRCKTSSFAMLVHRVADPVDSRIIANSDVIRIDKYNFEVSVGCILVDPVRI